MILDKVSGTVTVIFCCCGSGWWEMTYGNWDEEPAVGSNGREPGRCDIVEFELLFQYGMNELA